MDLSMLDSGITDRKMVWVNLIGRMAALTLVNLWTIRFKGKANTIGRMEIFMMANGIKMKSMVLELLKCMILKNIQVSTRTV